MRIYGGSVEGVTRLVHTRSWHRRLEGRVPSDAGGTLACSIQQCCDLEPFFEIMGILRGQVLPFRVQISGALLLPPALPSNSRGEASLLRPSDLLLR